MNAGISIKGMEPEWLAKVVDKSNKMIRAAMLEASGEVDTALGLYVEAAQIEEQLAEYCRGLGLLEKAYISAVSAAGLWARAGDLYRALQGYEALINDPTLTPRMRTHICGLADKMRERRRQWSVYSRQLRDAEEERSMEPARSEQSVSVG